MKTTENNRRNFLKQLLTASVFTAACPHLLLGEIKPHIDNETGPTITGVYSLDLDQYPQLKEIWGSLRLSVPKSDGGNMEEVMITRVPYEEYGRNFSVFNTKCPHEGNRIRDFDKITREYTCNGHGTVFNPMGTFIYGPAAQNLLTYNASSKWVEGDRYLQISFAFYEPSINSVNENSLFYLRKNHPNPFTEFTIISYGIEKDTNIKLEVLDISGRTIDTICDGLQSAGEYTYRFDAMNLPKGMYICKLSINGEEKNIIKMIKQ